MLGVTTLLSFVIGTVLGALAGTRSGPRFAKLALPAFMVLSAIPFYLVGLVLIYFLAFQNPFFPTGGGYSLGSNPAWSWSHALDVFKHSLLPALSIIVASIGFWAVGMRGMMVTVEGEDYMNFAEAKGLPPRRIFLGYGVRNALLAAGHDARADLQPRPSRAPSSSRSSSAIRGSATSSSRRSSCRTTSSSTAA